MSLRRALWRGAPAGGILRLRSSTSASTWTLARRISQNVLLLVAVVLALPQAELAAKPRKPPPPVLSPAQKLLDQGLQALAEKDFSRAYAALSESYRLAPSAEGLLQLGRLAAAEQRQLEAQDLLRRYLLDPARKPDEAMAQLAQSLSQGPSPPAGQVMVLAEPGALVSVDERLVGVLPLPTPLMLSPGDHRLAVEYPNKRLSGQITLAPGRQFEVRFDKTSGTLLVSLLPAILTINDLPNILPDARADIQTTIEQSVRAVDQTVLPLDQALIVAPHLRDCMSKPNCQQLLAQKSDVEYILSASLRRVEKGDGYVLRLVVRHRDVTEPSGSVETPCPKCSSADVVNLLGRTLPTLLASALKRRTGTLIVSSLPVSAEVLLGKSRLGTTPLRRLLWAEPIQLSVRAPGYKTVHTPVTLTPGQPLTLDLVLEPATQTVLRAEKRKTPLYKRWYLWTGVGAAALLTVTTGLLLGLVPSTHDKVGWLP